MADVPNHHRIRYKFAAHQSRGRTLDAACGVGYGTSIIKENVEEVVGVDKGSNAIGWAEKYFPGPKYICGDITKEPWEGQFETLVSLETIEHIQDPSPALKAFRRACTGHLIVSVPNEERYPFKAENFEGDESPHYRHYTPAEFDALLREHDFDVFQRCCQPDKDHPFIEAGTRGMFLIYICV